MRENLRKKLLRNSSRSFFRTISHRNIVSYIFSQHFSHLFSHFSRSIFFVAICSREHCHEKVHDRALLHEITKKETKNKEGTKNGTFFVIFFVIFANLLSFFIVLRSRVAGRLVLLHKFNPPPPDKKKLIVGRLFASQIGRRKNQNMILCYKI